MRRCSEANKIGNCWVENQSILRRILIKVMEQLTKCPICKQAVKESNLRKHLSKVHPDTSKTEVDSGPAIGSAYEKLMYRCKQCGKQYGRLACAAHLKNVHGFSPENPELSHEYFFLKKTVTITLIRKSSIKSLGNPTKGKDSPLKNSNKRDLLHLNKSSIDYKDSKRRDVGVKIHCAICNLSKSRRDAKRHFQKVHNWDLSLSEFINKVEHKKTTMKSWQDSRGEVKSDEEFSPNDYFNNVLVLSGGAYGLGKNRKH